MKQLFSIAAALLCVLAFALFSARDASAGVTRVSVGATAIIGTHREFQPVKVTGAAVVPAFRVSHRDGRFTLFGEGVSTLGPIAVSGVSNSLQSVDLSYLNFVLRYHLSRSMTFGVGETIYNQLSTYQFNFGAISPPPNFVYVFGSITRQRTRTVGARFELRDALYRSKRAHLEALFAVNPRLTARWTNSGVYLYSNGTSAAVAGPTISLPESGSQIDASIQNSVREHHYTLVYGIRYTNLSMFLPYHLLADRNAFVIPFIGIARSFGH
uniref:Uncharacterized protein n=1 Tax=mine drainage metagenome TaxID=410659 RepID=E6Q289_9ZZZZ